MGCNGLSNCDRNEVDKKVVEQTLRDMEQTQAKLRESIEQTKELAAKSEKLISVHRKELRSTQH